MSTLQSCPRCTQALPSSAAFCRRCGAAVELSLRPPAAPVGKSSSLVTPVLVALLISAIIGGGVVLFSDRHTPSATVVPVTAASPNPAYYNTPVQPPYPQVVNSRYPAYPTVVREAVPERYHEHSEDSHERGR